MWFKGNTLVSRRSFILCAFYYEPKAISRSFSVLLKFNNLGPILNVIMNQINSSSSSSSEFEEDLENACGLLVVADNIKTRQWVHDINLKRE